MFSRKITCCKCVSQPVAFAARSNWCAKHLRMHRMRKNAHGAGKYVPSFDELEVLFASLSPFACPVCETPLEIANATKTLVTLQHDANGQIRLLCYSCNCKHSRFADDAFYDIDRRTLGANRTHKICSGCGDVMPLSEFYKNAARHDGLSQNCKDCRRVIACLEK